MAIRIEDLRPAEDRILIVPDEAQEVTTGGIILPDASQERPCRGRVLAVGPGRFVDLTGQRADMPVKVGDGVYYSKFGGATLRLSDQPELMVCRPSEIIAVFDRECLK